MGPPVGYGTFGKFIRSRVTSALANVGPLNRDSSSNPEVVLLDKRGFI